MEAGSGSRLMAGPGWARSHGDGRLTTTVAGSITTTPGHGLRAVITIVVVVGGGRRWSHLIFHSGIRFAGTHYTIDSAIRILITIRHRIDCAQCGLMSSRIFAE